MSKEWNQATHALTIIGQQNLNIEQIKTLNNGGYLAAVAKATRDGMLPTLDVFKKTLGLMFDLNVYTGLSVQELCSNGHYAHSTYNMEEFLGQVFDYDQKLVARSYRLEVELFPTDSPSVQEEATAIMVEGFRPATIREFLTFGIEHPDVQRKFRIFCLAKARDNYLVCLDSNPMNGRDNTAERQLGYESWTRRNDLNSVSRNCVESRVLVVREN